MPNIKIAWVHDHKKDPTKSGRVKIRYYREHDDTQNVKDEDLPWASLSLPTNSASTNKIGVTPSGLVPGSRVLVTFLPEDVLELYPIVIGSLPRGDIDKEAENPKNKDNNSGGKIETPAPDNPSVSESDTDKEEVFKDGNTIYNNQKVLEQKKPEIKDLKYPKSPDVKSETAKKLSDVREKLAPNADKPTSASADKGQTNLPQLMQQIDPQAIAQVLPQMYSQLMQMTSILGMGSGMMGGGGGQNNPTDLLASDQSIPSGLTVVVEDSFTGALAILVKKYGFERVLGIFTNLLDNGGINKIDTRFQSLVKNSIANLIKVALYYGPLNIPVSVYDETIYGDIVPEPLVNASEVPDGYVKQYYSISNDPYPGYIHWLSSDRTKSVYVRREPGSYVFTCSSQEIYSISEKEIAEDLDPYVFTNSVLYLTTDILNEILAKQIINVEDNTTNNNMGNNSSQNNSGGGNMGGQLQSLLQMLLSNQLPKSVLNQNDVQKTMKQFTKDMSFNNQLFELGNQAMGGGSGGALSSLGNMGGLSNIMSGFNAEGGGISGVLGNLGGGNLLGSFGGFGGGSGGGGGGAGSGFPGASGGGNYSGGNISQSGLANISKTLMLLGIS